MSRSRKKTSIHGITLADSDKEYKKSHSKKERRKVKYLLHVEEYEIVESQVIRFDAWSSNKDGKRYFSIPKSHKLMRK